MQSLKDLLTRITWGKYIPSSEQDELKKINDEIKDVIINGQIETIIKTKKITKKGYESIKQIIEGLVEDGLTKEEAQEIIEDVIKEIEDDNLEKTLDGECDRYNKFTESNPAEYIRYDKNKNRYILAYQNEQTKSKDLVKLVDKLKEIMGDKKKENFRKFVSEKKIEYKGKKIIIYLTEDNKPYFDINHVINLSGVSFSLSRKSSDINLLVLLSKISGVFTIFFMIKPTIP
jgi:polyhydroxyalkanoate synthesis regulator phasin